MDRLRPPKVGTRVVLMTVARHRLDLRRGMVGTVLEPIGSHQVLVRWEAPTNHPFGRDRWVFLSDVAPTS
jgi:hypothetical protein